eukprot:scaffold40822_cov155-Skeletonema_dohrnii-CCMP3373.AAC.3
MKINQCYGSSMRLALLLMLSIASTRAMGLFDSLIIDEVTASLDMQTEEGGADPASTEFVESQFTHIVDAVVITTLEVNDFRHNLMAKYDDEPSSHETSQRYIASLMAIQYGMYDAVIDWSIVYTVAYAIIGGLTWYNNDTNFLTVIWGFSLMFCALILAVAGLKMPEWLGFYRMSQLKTIKDTSGFATKAVEDLSAEGSTIAAFRFQARLGVGKHFAQFFWLLLPFYTNLKERFTERRGYVVMGASAVIAIGSAAAFTRGVEIVNIGWNRGIGNSHVILPVCFFAWLVAIGLFHGWKFFEHRNFETDQDEPLLFASTVHDHDHDDGNAKSSTLETLAEGDESMEDALSEPLLDAPTSRRLMKKESLDAIGQGYFYQTAYFDRIKLKLPNMTSLSSGSDDDETNEKVTPQQVYKSVADSEDSEAGVKWYHRVWRFLPLTAVWGLVLVGTRDTCRCCARKGAETKSEFQEMSCGKKTWFVFRKFVKVLINFICFFFALVACGDSHQTGVTKTKLPFVHNIYSKLNDGPVCAYDVKCGDLKSFDSLEAAHAVNYSVAHCGVCSGCSTWQDLSVQWTTRKNAATLAQSCGIRYLFDQAGMAKCLARDFGWTEVCSEAWVHSVVCARENCGYIAIRTMITNRLGNFQMQQNDVTPATCNEAQCEQGNPGEFAKLSGASRRKMNIHSSIEREPDQQCQIVDNIPRDAEGRYNDWGPFFKELCPRSDSPP